MKAIGAVLGAVFVLAVLVLSAAAIGTPTARGAGSGLRTAVGTCGYPQIRTSEASASGNAVTLSTRTGDTLVVMITLFAYPDYSSGHFWAVVTDGVDTFAQAANFNNSATTSWWGWLSNSSVWTAIATTTGPLVISNPTPYAAALTAYDISGVTSTTSGMITQNAPSSLPTFVSVFTSGTSQVLAIQSDLITTTPTPYGWTLNASNYAFTGIAGFNRTFSATGTQTVEMTSNYGSAVMVALMGTCVSVPPAPTGVYAYSISATAVGVAWVNPPAITDVFIYIYSGFICGSLVGSGVIGPSVSFVWSGQPAATAFSFEVAAINSTGQGPNSACAGASTWPLVVVPPILSAVATGATSAALAWTAAQNMTTAPQYGYGYASTPSITVSVSVATALSVVVTGLTPNATYYFETFVFTGSAWLGEGSNIATVQTWPLDVGQTTWVNSTVYVNTTHIYYHNSTNWVNTTNVIDHNTTTFVNYTLYHNSTVFQNVTVNHYLYANVTKWVNTTVTVNRTIYANSTVYHNSTVYVNTTIGGAPAPPFPWGAVVAVVVFIALLAAALAYATSRRYTQRIIDET